MGPREGGSRVTGLDALQDFADRAVRLGSDLVRSTRPHQVREKGDRDVVTDVDVTVEHEIRAYLDRVTPGIGFLGEEEGRSSSGTGGDVWTLDPIDGTSNFTHGLPLCAVSLALVRDGQPIVAAITAPFLNLRYRATHGAGAYVNDSRMHASDTSSLARAIVSIGDYAVGPHASERNQRRLELTAHLSAQVERVRMFGSAALDLAWVAEGRTDGTIVLGHQPWDTAAGVLIAREAGAVVTDARGDEQTIASTETVAASTGVAEALLSLVRAA